MSDLFTHPVITITIYITTCELGGVPALLLPKTFSSNGAWVKPRQPAQMGKGQLRYPPQRTRGTFGRERGQCQQVELREEGGAAGYLGGGAPI